MSDRKKNDAMSAIERLIAAFSTHDKDAYFSCFADDATFLFHNMGKLLTKSWFLLIILKTPLEDYPLQFTLQKCAMPK